MTDWEVGDRAWIALTVHIPRALVEGHYLSVKTTNPAEVLITRIVRDNTGAIVTVTIADVTGHWGGDTTIPALYRDREACEAMIRQRATRAASA